MVYRVLPDGSIETDSITEAMALASFMASNPKPGYNKAVTPAVIMSKKTPAKAAGVQKSWDEARKLAKKEGITVQEARSKLAKQKD